MAGKRRGKKIAKFSKKMQKKLVVLFVIIALLLLGLIVRLMYIEHTSGKKYEKKVLSQQKYDSTVIPSAWKYYRLQGNDTGNQRGCIQCDIRL